jgi:hypothetical protein
VCPCSSNVRRHHAEAAAIRAVYVQRGEFAAAIELRRLFPGVTDNRQACECARNIADWQPLRLRLVKEAGGATGRSCGRRRKKMPPPISGRARSGPKLNHPARSRQGGADDWSGNRVRKSR